MKTSLFRKSSFKIFIGYAFLLLLIFACKSKIQTSASQPVGEKDWPEHFGFGKSASPGKIAIVDIDVRPDGKGLPAGSGTAAQGQKLYTQKCAACHGGNGVEGPYNRLVSSDTSKAKAIGNYWPYATTVFDYIRRAMPFDAPGSLTDQEVYDATAFLLYKNKLIDSASVIDAQSLPKVVMPAKKLFVVDDRKGGTEIR